MEVDMSDWDKLLALLAEYDELLEVFGEAESYLELQTAEARLDEFVKQYPDIMFYDSRGNWLGPVVH
jgi:hypothetical protein